MRTSLARSSSSVSLVGGIEQRGHFEQEATEGTEMESVLCFLRYLLLNSEAAVFRADKADFFSCVSRLSRLHFRRSGRAGRHCEFIGSAGDFEILLA